MLEKPFDPERLLAMLPEKLPAAKMLPYYASRFRTVEINYTFYRMPTAKLVTGWAAQVPDDFKFTKCQLWLLTTKAREPDVTLAWKLADSLPKLSPTGRREYDSREARMLTAMVLARAGLGDSAREVARRARGGPR